MKRQLLALSLLASGTFGALGNPPPAMAGPIYETEPNNTVASATVLPDFTSSTSTVQRWVRGSVQSGTIDYYRFNVTNSEFRLSLRFSSVSNSTGAYLFYDANGDGREDSDSEYVGTFHSTTGKLVLDGMRRGRYFVRIFSNASNYDFIIGVTPFQSQYEVESNNTHFQANKLTGAFLVGSRYLAGVISSPTDYDWYTFEQKKNNRLDVRLATDNSPLPLRVDLYLDANNNGFLESYEWRGGKYTDSSGNAHVLHYPPGNGKYFVRVSKPSNGRQFYELTLSARR